jgi:hypothetical protein
LAVEIARSAALMFAVISALIASPPVENEELEEVEDELALELETDVLDVLELDEAELTEADELLEEVPSVGGNPAVVW